MNRRPLDLASFYTEIFQIPTLLVRHPCPQAQPLIPQLHASSQVEIFDESTCSKHDFDQGFGSDALIVCLCVQGCPQLSIKTHIMPCFGNTRHSYDLSGRQEGEDLYSNLVRKILPEVEGWPSGQRLLCHHGKGTNAGGSLESCKIRW